MTDIRKEVRRQYGKIGASGRTPGSCCTTGCCSPLETGARPSDTDIVATAPLPDEIRENIELHVGCIAGAATIDETREMLATAGFEQIRIETIEASSRVIGGYFPGLGLENYVVSATIEAMPPWRYYIADALPSVARQASPSRRWRPKQPTAAATRLRQAFSPCCVSLYSPPIQMA